MCCSVPHSQIWNETASGEWTPWDAFSDQCLEMALNPMASEMLKREEPELRNSEGRIHLLSGLGSRSEPFRDAASLSWLHPPETSAFFKHPHWKTSSDIAYSGSIRPEDWLNHLGGWAKVSFIAGALEGRTTHDRLRQTNRNCQGC